MEPQIGTILVDVSPTTNLKHFVVYDTTGKSVWATDGFKDAEIVKKEDKYFVIYADGEYRAFHCEEINQDTGLYCFFEGYYKSYIDYHEIQNFEKNRMSENKKEINGTINSTQTEIKENTIDSTVTLEKFKIEVAEKIKDMENIMRKTISKYNEYIERNKKNYEDTLAKYRKMNNLDSVIESHSKYKNIIQDYKNQVSDLKNKLGIQKQVIIEWQEKAEQKESTITSLNGKISELQMAVANYEKNNENIIEAMASERAKDKVEKLKEVIAKKDEILKSYNKNLKIICAVNVFLLLLLAYAVTLIW